MHGESNTCWESEIWKTRSEDEKLSQEKVEEDLSKKFPETVAKSKELFETMVKEVGFWRSSHLDPKGEMTFELPYPSSGSHTELPEGIVKLIEQIWANFEFPFPAEDGYYNAVVRVPYWDNSWYLSKKTLVRTKSRDVLNYLQVYSRFFVQYEFLLKKHRKARGGELRQLIRQLGRLMEKEEPRTPYSVPLYIIE